MRYEEYHAYSTRVQDETWLKSGLTPAEANQITPDDDLRLHTVTKQAVHINGIVTMFERIGDLRVRSWFRVFEIIPVGVLLGTSFIYRCTRGIFPIKSKVVSCHSHLLSRLSAFPNGKFDFLQCFSQ